MTKNFCKKKKKKLNYKETCTAKTDRRTFHGALTYRTCDTAVHAACISSVLLSCLVECKFRVARRILWKVSVVLFFLRISSPDKNRKIGIVIGMIRGKTEGRIIGKAIDKIGRKILRTVSMIIERIICSITCQTENRITGSVTGRRDDRVIGWIQSTIIRGASRK